MTNAVMFVESYFLSNHFLFQTTERFGVKDISFEKEEYVSYQIGSESSVMSIFKKKESDCDSHNESLDAIEVDIHTAMEDDETSKWETDAEHIKNLVKEASNKPKMIDYIKDCRTVWAQIFLHRLLQDCLLNPSRASETSNEHDQADSLKEINNLFCMPFRTADLNSLFFEGLNNNFLINFIFTEGNSLLIPPEELFREDKILWIAIF